MSTGTVTGRYTDTQGRPAKGSITFYAAPDRLVDAPNKTVILPDPVTVELDSNGRLSVALLATNSPGVTPTGWSWKTEHNIGITQNEFSFLVPAGTTQDLATLATVASSTGTPEAAWWTQQRGNVVSGHMSGTDLVLDKADGTSVTVGSVLDPVKAPVSVDINNGVGGLVRLTRMDRIVVGSIISAPSNIGSGSSYTFGKVPEGFRPINQGQINEMTLGPAFNANTSKMTGAWQYINLDGAIDHSLAMFTTEANGFWIGSIIWATNDTYPA